MQLYTHLCIHSSNLSQQLANRHCPTTLFLFYEWIFSVNTDDWTVQMSVIGEHMSRLRVTLRYDPVSFP